MILFIHSFPFLHHHLSQHIFVVDFILGDKKEKDGKWCNNSSKRWKDPQNVIKENCSLFRWSMLKKKNSLARLPAGAITGHSPFWLLTSTQQPKRRESIRRYSSRAVSLCMFCIIIISFFLSFFCVLCLFVLAQVRRDESRKKNFFFFFLEL